MDIEKYFRSLSLEMTALKDRVRDFIDDTHWLTDGEWKESVLRSMLARNLPPNIQVGRGFILTSSGVSTQIDILLYSSDSPVFFRDGDLVFVQPEAVKGVIEVKTKLNRQGLKKSVSKIKAIGDMLAGKSSAFLSIFSYESNVRSSQYVLDLLLEQTKSIEQIVHFLCLGESHFVRYWATAPDRRHRAVYEKWHSYQLEMMAYGYFIHNVLLSLMPEYVDNSQELWFPETSKEIYKNGEIQRQRGANETQRLDDVLAV
ncbi:MAG: hypothetical protein Q7W05_11895 [Deltaproteobacteria bacterium]|nr:hypothetical protein [Deltaproteobacteria bacterium]